MLEIPFSQRTEFPPEAFAVGWDTGDVLERRITLSQCRVFFDFDKTISLIDVIDDLIERFAVDDKWRLLETLWQAGEIGSEECLRGQFRSVRATRQQMEEYLAQIDIDPSFHRIMALLKSRDVHPLIVSDSFNFLIETILRSHDVHGVKVLANHLRMRGDRIAPAFPHRHVLCHACANCKTAHVLNEDSLGKVLVYVGDGRSDYCASMQAQVVFAKDSLAAYLRQKGKKFIEYTNLKDVHDVLKGLAHG